MRIPVKEKNPDLFRPKAGNHQLMQKPHLPEKPELSSDYLLLHYCCFDFDPGYNSVADGTCSWSKLIF